jgi:hypothetical protein
MNKKDIIRMAREAGLLPEKSNIAYQSPFFEQQIERFADLVASAERRNCVDTLCAAGVASKDDDLEWAEVAFWCCSRINNPIPTDKTFAVNYNEIDNARRRA